MESENNIEGNVVSTTVVNDKVEESAVEQQTTVAENPKVDETTPTPTATTTATAETTTTDATEKNTSDNKESNTTNEPTIDNTNEDDISKKPHLKKIMVEEEDEEDEEIYSTQAPAKSSSQENNESESKESQDKVNEDNSEKEVSQTTTTTTTTTTSSDKSNEDNNEDGDEEEGDGEGEGEEVEDSKEETKEERRERKKAKKEAKKAKKEAKKAKKEAKKLAENEEGNNEGGEVSKTTGDVDFDEETTEQNEQNSEEEDKKPKRLGRKKSKKTTTTTTSDDTDDVFDEEMTASQEEPKKKRKKDEDEDYKDEEDEDEQPQENNENDGEGEDGEGEDGGKKKKRKSKKEPKEPKEPRKKKRESNENSFSKDLGKRNIQRKVDVGKLLESEKPAVIDLIERMTIAYQEDNIANKQKKPALNKTKLLPQVDSMLSKKILHSVCISNGIFEVISEWLKPLPDGSQPNHKIKEVLLKGLFDLPPPPSDLECTPKIGRAITSIKRSDSESPSIKKLAYDIFDKWTRPTQIRQEFNDIVVDQKQIQSPLHSSSNGDDNLQLLSKKYTDYLPEHIKHATGCQKVTLDYVNRPVNGGINQHRPVDSPVRTINRIDKEIASKLKKTTYKGSPRAHNISVEGRRMFS
ncbi:hypothetical protein RB653_001857 [Dictyostelium firmibasis]|uniref:TFIIS N-terminal domain-containing protein n=1 Tax=Dictyostelium firmibasis TaxID=79012 RepID=A0AAN7YYC0_9MYCE